ncbi:non-canonical purine NTP diphosphatase [Tannerella forsythia]|uniref:dITP/XTP pyrophosphatase n=1 Tax=Tannerella forsythia TaxID=28112 RepID=A0A3P1XU06_TANFO|nr:non-canonical purine NTP diphosphatase [Tannerella forsythia]RRD61438.1 non-canonical purine NTP diphosphatase [Tannerella forsythia]RRD74677.1 non-canonical purine NTP diphosphatase [Tannerella forsythia]
MKTLVFATNNEHKLREVRAIMPPDMEILSLSDIKCSDELPETSPSLEGNAMQKARYVKMKFGYDCFADDTGLEVDALRGEPGVYSARYAGPECDSTANIRKLLGNLTGKANRNARFRTVIALIMDGSEYLFEGMIYGRITQTMRGSNGFGYDPVFVPDGYKQTFAELDESVKNGISHRARAIRKLTGFLSGM